MALKEDGRTIFAVATAFGRAAVAIVRISGPRAGVAFKALAGPLPKPRYAAYRILRDEAGGALDRALTLWFPAPASFTGENCVEFHLHGSRAVIRAVLGRLARLEGLRPAYPGEFARQAVRNGKLGIVEAEQLADLIDSETEQQRLQSLRTSRDIALRLDGWRTDIIEASALIEAELDFAEEEHIDRHAIRAARSRVAEIAADMRSALTGIQNRARLRDGVRVALAGPPNVGKSSLMNALVRREQSIVSPIAGTTRDSIEAAIEIDGYLVILTDTAGLRDSEDPVEQQGMARTLGRVSEADLMLWLEDGFSGTSERPTTNAEVWTIETKSDLRSPINPGRGVLLISSVRGDNIDELRRRLGEFAADRCADDGSGLRQRHEGAVRSALVALEEFLDSGEAALPEIGAEILRAARSALPMGEDVDSEAVLSSIFSRFCIGK
jgi:tRNA modification GTPase